MAEHDFETVSSETVYRGNILALRADQVRMPGGHIAKREVIEHYGAVAVAAVDDAGRVAMVYQYRHAIGRRLWELPAGLLDVPGEDPVVSAARELAEETDLRAARWDLLVDAYTSPGYSDELIRLYLARDLSPVPVAERHERQDEEAGLVTRRVDLDEAVAMALRGEILNAACLIGVFAAADLRAHGWRVRRPLDAPMVEGFGAGG